MPKNPAPDGQPKESAAARESQIQKLLGRLKSVRPEEMIVNSYSHNVVTRSVKGPLCWVESPAQVRLLKVSDDYLSDLAEMAEDDEHGTEPATQNHKLKPRVNHVRAGYLKKSKLLFIWVTTAEDPEAITVKRNRSGALINTITVLAPAQATVPTNHKYRFGVMRVTREECPFDVPALMIDMTRPQNEGLTSREKSRAKGKAAAKKTAPKTQPDAPSKEQVS